MKFHNDSFIDLCKFELNVKLDVLFYAPVNPESLFSFVSDDQSTKNARSSRKTRGKERRVESKVFSKE